MRWSEPQGDLGHCGRAWPLLACLLVLPLPSQADRAAQPGLHAERITEANAATRRVGGPHGIGGIGDWSFGNGTLCAAVADLPHETAISPRGGVLVDLGHCGRGDDTLLVLQPLRGFGPEETPPVDEIRAERDAGEARVVTTGVIDGLRFETSWGLGKAEPRALFVRSRITREGPGARLRIFTDTLVHDRSSLPVFAADSQRRGYASGFDHAAVDMGSPRSLLGALHGRDLHVLLGGDGFPPGIAYGLHAGEAWYEDADGSRRPVGLFSLNAKIFSLLGVFARPFWLGGNDVEPGLLELAQLPFFDVSQGDSLVYERRLIVGERADVASVTDQVWSDAPKIHGRVDDPAARIHVSDPEGTAFTQVRPEPDGRFALRAPPGSWELRFVAPGGREVRQRVSNNPKSVDLGLVEIGEPARVELPRGSAMRVVFVPEAGSPEPRLRDDLVGLRFGGRRVTSDLESNEVYLTGTARDPARLTLPTGRYRVFASRGPEYTVSETRIQTRPGHTVALELEPPLRALETPGWISADLHVHASPSFDSILPLRQRVASYLAQGAEVLVSTDHDAVTDYGPVVSELGLEKQLATVVGGEVTSTIRTRVSPFTSGHLNAIPLAYRPRAYRMGFPAHEDRRLRGVIASVRDAGARFVQLNHPRGDDGPRTDGNYFMHLGVGQEPFDPSRPLAAAPNHALIERDASTGLRDLDFDGLELLNGEEDLARYFAVRADWFSLLLQGEVHTATANSDSHDLGQLVALPRNYVRVPDDRVETFDEAAFVDALRGARVYGTTGPLLEVRLGEADIGERFVGRHGSLRLLVRSAPWVPVSQVRVFVNARLVHGGPIEPGIPLVLPLDFDGDGFVTVEVEGEPDPVFRALTAAETRPFAFSNPIFVDADGDGRWSAPGLPSPLPPSIASPLEAASLH